jgi:hypothetical protein
MELAIRIQVDELPEGLYLATSEELPGSWRKGGRSPKPLTSRATLHGS